MKRGDLVTMAQGKPRPALVIQSDMAAQAITKTVLPLSSTLVDASMIRVTVEPTPENGLRAPSQIMIDKAVTLPTDKIGPAFGTLDGATMIAVNRALALFFGIAG